MYRIATVVGELLFGSWLTICGVQVEVESIRNAKSKMDDASGRALYFIAACPYQIGDLRFPADLYTIRDRTLEPVTNLVPQDRGTWFVHPYHDENLVVLCETPSWEQERVAFVLVKTDSPWTSKVIELSLCPGCSLLRCHLFESAARGLTLGCKVAQKGNVYELRGLMLDDGAQETLPWEIYRTAVISGMVGGGMEGDDYSYVAGDEEGRLAIPIDGNRSIASGFTLPKELGVKQREAILICVNNRTVLAIIAASQQSASPPGIGKSKYYVFRKKDRQWDSAVVDGARTYVRGFGNWLVGAVADVERPAPSPGGELRRKSFTTTGIPADWRFKNAGFYCPGILFLYNAITRKKILIPTGQGDSEVLLVDGETVYYRINESIYGARIGQHGVEEANMIAKDPVVADIHWAFWGPKKAQRNGN